MSDMDDRDLFADDEPIDGDDLITSAFDSINPSEASKARMLDAILATAAEEGLLRERPAQMQVIEGGRRDVTRGRHDQRSTRDARGGYRGRSGRRFGMGAGIAVAACAVVLAGVALFAGGMLGGGFSKNAGTQDVSYEAAPAQRSEDTADLAVYDSYIASPDEQDVAAGAAAPEADSVTGMTNASTSSQANPPKSLESRITLTCDLGEYACDANAFVFVDEAQVG
ncbi:MAG: hypothetical protein IJJ14_02580, partial [Coriobacteriales bacterium]|nr:hypothetical protein [Coriobacteriales bacterium]